MFTCVVAMLIVAATAYAIASFAVARFATFSSAYNAAHAAERKETWLRAQCMNTTFYANMAQHSDICDAVQRRHGPVVVGLHAAVSVPPGDWAVLVCGLPVAACLLRWLCRALKGRRRRQRDMFL